MDVQDPTGLSTKDTRACWAELKLFYSLCQTSKISSQKISAYLTTTRLEQINWRGNQQQFINHYQEQSRLYNEMVKPVDRYSDSMLVQFLSLAVSGVPNLAQVGTLHQMVLSAGGTATTMTFPEYVAALGNAAQMYDGSNVLSRNPRARRAVNSHQLQFDDEDDHTIDVYTHEMEVQAHDWGIDTPLELIVNQANTVPTNAPRPVRLNFQTWNSLDSEDQTKWDTISEKGKKSIIDYASNRAIDN